VVGVNASWLDIAVRVVAIAAGIAAGVQHVELQWQGQDVRVVMQYLARNDCAAELRGGAERVNL